MTIENNPVEKCLECHLPKSKEGSYSLTQWISVCTCEYIDEIENKLDKVVFCGSCNKRVVQARKGSFTQWVFRSDLCTCEEPQPVVRDEALTDLDRVVPFEAAVDEEYEIEIGETRFPRDRFKPIGILGQGSTGSVYLCRDRLLNKKVAVKCLSYLSDELLVAFQREARINTKLDHPNIAKAVDFGVFEQKAPYMVVEYMEGLSLEHHLSIHGEPDVEIAIDILIQVCRAIEYAHNQGVMHRDVKAGNVLFIETESDEPMVSVIDFGLAKVDSAEEHKGHTGVVGTPRYMSSDQAQGLPYDERSEIYSIGCLGFELLTGNTPFEAESPLELINKHAFEKPPLLSEARPDKEFSDLANSVISKSLKKERDERYQSVGEFRKALEELRTEDELFIDPESELQAERVEKNRVLPIVVVAALVILFGGALFQILAVMNSKPEVVTTRDEKEIVDPHTKNDIEAKLTGGEVVYSQKEGYMHPNNILGYMDDDMKTLQGKNYTAVSFYGTGIDGSGLVHIKDEPIRRLSLDYTRITDDTMGTINELFPNLWGLHVEYTQISNACVFKLTNLKNLHQFTVNGTKVTNEVVPYIVKEFPKLIKLSFVKTKITDEGVKPVQDLVHLQEFYFDQTTMGDKTIDVIRHLPIHTLSFSSSLVTDKSFPKLVKMKRLRIISLANCRYITRKGLIDFQKARPDVKIIKVDVFDPLNVSF